MNENLTKSQKQDIINKVTAALKTKQWFNGAGFVEDRLVVAYNYYPAFEALEFRKTISALCPVEWEMKDIRTILPLTRQDDDIPSHMQ